MPSGIRTRTSGIMVSINVLPAPAASANAWNPADKSANVTLSNGNLTATATAGGYQGVRALDNASAGKLYWEIHIDTTIAGELAIFGFGNSAATLGGFVGSTNDACGYDPDAGLIWLNAVSTAVQTGTNGDTICVALDLGNTKLWVRTVHLGVAGNWNNSATDDPATNTGGFNFSTINAGPYFAMASVNASPTAVTANFGASAYSQTPPSGFSNWP